MGIQYTHDFDKARSVKPHEYNAGDIGVSNIVNLAENLHQEFQLRVRGQKHHGKGVAAKKNIIQVTSLHFGTGCQTSA